MNPRHLSLIADFMTRTGSYLAMNRGGMNECASPFLQMSFETTSTFLTKAASEGNPHSSRSYPLFWTSISYLFFFIFISRALRLPSPICLFRFSLNLLHSYHTASDFRNESPHAPHILLPIKPQERCSFSFQSLYLSNVYVSNCFLLLISI